MALRYCLVIVERVCGGGDIDVWRFCVCVWVGGCFILFGLVVVLVESLVPVVRVGAIL